MATFKGSQCLWNCEGHMAGYNYSKNGGAKPSPHSPSFNSGMKIAQTEAMQPALNRVAQSIIKPRKR